MKYNLSIFKVRFLYKLGGRHDCTIRKCVSKLFSLRYMLHFDPYFASLTFLDSFYFLFDHMKNAHSKSFKGYGLVF